MKDYGTGLIRCDCSHAMRKGKRVRVTGSTPRRKACPNCKKMSRILYRKITVARRPGVKAAKKQRSREKTNEHVLRLEAENRRLKAAKRRVG